MFAYCRNNPVSRKDLNGFSDTDAVDIEKAKKQLESLLECYTTFSESGFSINLDDVAPLWNARIQEIGTQEAYDYMSNYLCSKYYELYGEEFLFSNECVSYEIEYHIDAYMCMQEYSGYSRNITTYVFSKTYLIAHCKTVDIYVTDVDNRKQSTMFGYKNGIRECYKETDKNPFRKK